MTIDTKRLRELAMAATPGPWEVSQTPGFGHDDAPYSVVNEGDEQVAECWDNTPGHWDPKQHTANTAFIAAANPQTVVALLDDNERLRDALTKISAIRDSIVGMQGFNFSEHAYPLVAALDGVGFKGAGYEIARKNLGTLIEQLAAMTAARDEALMLQRDAQIQAEDRGQSYKRLRAALDALRHGVDGYDQSFAHAEWIAAGSPSEFSTWFDEHERIGGK